MGTGPIPRSMPRVDYFHSGAVWMLSTRRSSQRSPADKRKRFGVKRRQRFSPQPDPGKFTTHADAAPLPRHRAAVRHMRRMATSGRMRGDGLREGRRRAPVRGLAGSLPRHSESSARPPLARNRPPGRNQAGGGAAQCCGALRTLPRPARRRPRAVSVVRQILLRVGMLARPRMRVQQVPGDGEV